MRALGLARWWRRAPRWVLADAARLPFADESADLVFSNLMLHWHPTPHVVFPEWKRVLSVGGLLMFSCFGPGHPEGVASGCRRDAPACASDAVRRHARLRRHAGGERLRDAGHGRRVHHAHLPQSARTVRRRCGPWARVRWTIAGLRCRPVDGRASCWRHWPRVATAAGRIPLTFEVAYGHAWKPAPRTVGVSKVSLESLRQGPPRGKQ